MDAMDQIFARLPEVTKQRLLATESMRQHNPTDGEGQFESAEVFNAYQEPPLDFLVDGLLARGHLAMLGGRSKSGKSWLVAQLAQSLDTGQPFLGRDVQPARVLYLALEDKRSRLKRRSIQLGWTPRTTVFDYRIGRFNGPAGQVGPGLQLIERVAWDFDVILIDTLIATLDGNISENDNTQMATIVNELAEIAHAMQCAILLVHHTNKGMSDDVFNLLRGASALRGAYDVGLLLDRRQGEREAVLHIEARDFMTESLTIRQREDGSGWEMVGGAKAISRIRTGRRMIDAITEFPGGVTVDELCEHLQISRQSISQQLNSAERDGTVVRRPGPLNGKAKGRPKELWFMADDEAKDGPIEKTATTEEGSPLR